MKTILTIAWRNLWRNKRRTFITMASIFFALFFAILMRSFQLGTYVHMINQSIEQYSGYLQVQHPDYLDDPGPEQSIAYNPQWLSRLIDQKNIKAVVPRIDGFALASWGLQSKGVIVQGINPVLEQQLSDPVQKLAMFNLSPILADSLITNLALTPQQLLAINEHLGQYYTSAGRIADGLLILPHQWERFNATLQANGRLASEYLNPADPDILIGTRLARFFNIEVGDSLILLGQGYQGATAAGIFRVKGLVMVPAPDVDNKLVYMDLGTCQAFYGLEGRITNMAINLYKPKNFKTTQNLLKSMPELQNCAVQNWTEFNPTLKQQIDGDNVSGQMFVAILYFIIFFGIFGTITMMMAERRRELGVMLAIGMQKARLALMLVTEMVIMGVLATTAALVAIAPGIVYLNRHPVRLSGQMAKAFEDMGFDPVMPMAWFDAYFWWQAAVIMFMVLLACIIPLHSIYKLSPLKALQNH
jgi:putative ABC transport system permease protein